MLHKNSTYYHDLIVLSECLHTLSTGASLTSKKVCLNFIESCLVSNNLNKVYGVYYCGVLPTLQQYLLEDLLGPTILRIY